MRFLSVLVFVFAASSAAAQTVAPPAVQGSGNPVAIEADKQLEWIKGDNKFRATGNVSITQGNTTIKGDEAEASYDAAKGPSALTVLTVTGNVTIVSGANTITADTASYDTRTETAQLRGRDIVLTAPKAKVTAKNGMDYFARERKIVSKGAAVLTQGTDRLTADAVTAWLTEANDLHKATAQGHVVITQQSKDGANIAQADRGDYDAVKKTAQLTGNVRLTQGQNHMQGDVATIDLNTGYSALQNNAAAHDGGRVRAIFNTGDTGKASFMPSVKTAIPSVDAKAEFEQPYAVGKARRAEDDNRSGIR